MLLMLWLCSVKMLLKATHGGARCREGCIASTVRGTLNGCVVLHINVKVSKGKEISHLPSFSSSFTPADLLSHPILEIATTANSYYRIIRVTHSSGCVSTLLHPSPPPIPPQFSFHKTLLSEALRAVMLYMTRSFRVHCITLYVLSGLNSAGGLCLIMIRMISAGQQEVRSVM